MADIYNETTAFLVAESLEAYISVGIQCLLFGLFLYSLLSLLSYGIIQALRLFNINP